MNPMPLNNVDLVALEGAAETAEDGELVPVDPRVVLALVAGMRERDAARAQASEHHRRAQKAEAVIAKGIHDQIGITGRGNLGRGLANVAAYHYRDRALAAEAERDELREALERLRSTAARAYEQATVQDRLLHTHKELRAALQTSGRALAGQAEP